MEKCRKCREPLPEGARFCPSCGAKQDIQRKPKTRGNGTGSVYKLPNGTWIAVKILRWEVDENGKAHRVTASKSGFKTKKEALQYLPNLTPQSKEEKRKAITFKQLYDLWEPTHQRSYVTMKNYSSSFKHFSVLWNIPVADITVDDLQDCMDNCPAGKRTAENMKTVCGLLYKYAIPRNLATLNMAQYLENRAANTSMAKEGLPMDALEKLVNSVGTVPYADYIVAQCYLGFRPSELLALDIANYDRKNKTLTGGAKTEAGKNRVVTISPKIQPIIDRLTADKIAGPIFCSDDGSRMRINEYRDKFYRILEACGIENPVTVINGRSRWRYTPHSCRHTFSTLMKNVQAPDKDKLALIGHTKTEMMMHYQDVDLDGLRRITDAI